MEQGLRELVMWDQAQKKEKGLVFTAQEIAQQPEMWRDTADRILAQREAWMAWQKEAGMFGSAPPRIVLAGAGSSYYAALCVQPLWRQLMPGSMCEVLPTTRIVTDPEGTLGRSETLLLVSLARSGMNPETVGSVTLADELSGRSYHLAITCNAHSFLGHLANERPHAYSVTLHENTRDKGIAMTSSFTSLVIAAQALAACGRGEDVDAAVHVLVLLGEHLIEKSARFMGAVRNHPFRRAFVLGDGALYGAALEGALKLMELSDGMVVGIGDSCLAARHGFAAMVDEETLIVHLLSSDPYVRAYQADLVREMRARRSKSRTVAVSLHPDPELQSYVDYLVVLDESETWMLDDLWRAPLDTLVMQCLALQHSLDLGLRPDQPFRAPSTQRAIESVRLIPYKRRAKEL